MPVSRWSEDSVSRLDALEALVYRSQLLGGDRTIVNYGGGNTSSKVKGADHLGREVDILWIKSSGSDLATVGPAGFAALRLDDVLQARNRDGMSDEDVVDYLSSCSLGPAALRPSIETMLHAFLPFSQVDHTHPEAAIAFCCCDRGEDLARECFGDELAWVPYVRPGFALAKLALHALETNPATKGMLLARHGLVTWGETGSESYGRTVDFLSRASTFLERHVDPDAVFGGPALDPPASDVWRRVMVDLLPVIRGRLSLLEGEAQRLVLHWDASTEVMRFVNSRDMAGLATTGAACPDHVMYTKFKPALVDADGCRQSIAAGSAEPVVKAVSKAIEDYAVQYARFFEENREGDVDMLSPGPRVLLVPGFGLIAAGRDAWTASNTASLYRTAINVMRWASSNGGYASLSPKEAWDIEYWPLELYKLTLGPPPRDLAGHIAVVTGGAGAIGTATAERLLDDDCHVVISDVDARRAEETAAALGNDRRPRLRTSAADVVLESDVRRMFEEAVLAFGGVDIVVANAGVASAGPIEETTLEEWQRVHDVILRGCFLTCRGAFGLMRRQQIGGSIVINGSKNGLAAGKDAIAYTTAKAGVHHMARCLAEEGGPLGVRVNAVAPDAVIRGSGLWSPDWRAERARAYGFDVDELEEYYRRRNALKVSVTALDVAETIAFLASKRSAKTTGCVITVDGGLAVAYPR